MVRSTPGFLLLQAAQTRTCYMARVLRNIKNGFALVKQGLIQERAWYQAIYIV